MKVYICYICKGYSPKRINHLKCEEEMKLELHRVKVQKKRSRLKKQRGQVYSNKFIEEVNEENIDQTSA